MRRSRLASVVLLAGVAIWGSTALAAPTGSAFASIPSRFSTDDLSIASRGSGETCLSLVTMPDGNVCNPAYLPFLNTSSLQGRIFIGNGYAALSTADQLLFQPISKDFLHSLFDKRNVTSLEANASVVFATQHFSATFTPYRVQYTSEVHNPDFPVVAIHAALERGLTLAGGWDLVNDPERIGTISAGSSLRLIHRSYIHSAFSFLDPATVDNARELLPVHSQNALFLDPSIAWMPARAPWKLRVSVAASNLGFTNPHDPLYPTDADLGMGIGVSPHMPIGDLNLGLDLGNLIHGETLASRLRGTANYGLGILTLMMGANANSFTGGLQFGLDVVQIGIVYEMVQNDLGTVLSPSDAGTRVSTEVAIRL